MDVVRPPGLLFLQRGGFHQLRVGQDDGQGRLQLVGGVGQKLPLLRPGPFHRAGHPPAQDHGHRQQQNKGCQGDLEIGAHHGLQGRLLHGDVHEGDLGEESVVPPKIPQMIAGDGALRRILAQALPQNGGQLRRVLNVFIGAAGDIDRAAVPDLHREIGQLDVAGAQIRAPLSAGKGQAALLLQHPFQHGVADPFRAVLGRGVYGYENHCQHGGDQQHTHRHELQPQALDHGEMLPSPGTRHPIIPPRSPGSSQPCGWS